MKELGIAGYNQAFETIQALFNLAVLGGILPRSTIQRITIAEESK